MRYVSLTLFLFAFWLALSGHYTSFLLLMGIVATALCVILAVRMHVLDEEAHPMHLFSRALSYWPWLAVEIAKSGWGVTKVVLNPSLPASPTMTIVRSTQSSLVGVATYANSITLTPGTVTTNVRGNLLTVHALVTDGANDVEAGEMDRRVTRFEGES